MRPKPRWKRKHEIRGEISTSAPRRVRRARVLRSAGLVAAHSQRASRRFIEFFTANLGFSVFRYKVGIVASFVQWLRLEFVEEIAES